MANPLHDGPQFSGEQRELGKSFPTRAPKAVVSTNTPWHLWDSPWSCLMSRHPLLSWSCCSGVSLSGSNQCSNSFIHHLPRLQTLSPNNRIFSYWKRASYKLYVHLVSLPALLFQDFFFFLMWAIFKSLHWICYNIASILYFDSLAPGHVGS